MIEGRFTDRFDVRSIDIVLSETTPIFLEDEDG